MPLVGADSATPHPNLYAGHDVWGVYVAGSTPHIWTPAEVKDLAAHGVRGAMPIVVPSQEEPWWATDQGAEALVRLVAFARAWGLHVGSPLCLDIEEATAEHIAATHGLAKEVESRWANACATYGYHPWTYGGKIWHEAVGDPSSALKWLAEWPNVRPANPPLPPDYHAWQYASGPDIDLDVFEPGRTYLSTSDLQPITLEANVRDRETGAVIPGTEDEETPAEESTETPEAADTPVEEVHEAPVEAPPAPAVIDVATPAKEHTAAIRQHLDALDALVEGASKS